MVKVGYPRHGFGIPEQAATRRLPPRDRRAIVVMPRRLRGAEGRRIVDLVIVLRHGPIARCWLLPTRSKALLIICRAGREAREGRSPVRIDLVELLALAIMVVAAFVAARTWG